MPRDPRPYTTYPLNYSTHPRFEGLTDAAFRTFHEMQDYSRVHGLDGLVPVAHARKKWRRRALDELVRGAPGTDRPLVELQEGGYFIRSYEEHQFTTADAAALREKRAAAGAAGGRAKAGKRVASARGSGKQTGWQNVAESESELEETDKRDFPGPLTQGDGQPEPTDEEFIAEQAATVGIRNLARIRKALDLALPNPHTHPISDAQAIDLTRAVISLATSPVRSVEAYVEKACVNSPDEVRAQFEVLSKGWPS
jgi:hypothetical protein